MKYTVSFSVTDMYPAAEVEANDRDQAIKLYQEMWKGGQLSGVKKEARYSIVSPKVTK